MQQSLTIYKFSSVCIAKKLNRLKSMIAFASGAFKCFTIVEVTVFYTRYPQGSKSPGYHYQFQKLRLRGNHNLFNVLEIKTRIVEMPVEV